VYAPLPLCIEPPYRCSTHVICIPHSTAQFIDILPSLNHSRENNGYETIIANSKCRAQVLIQHLQTEPRRHAYAIPVVSPSTYPSTLPTTCSDTLREDRLRAWMSKGRSGCMTCNSTRMRVQVEQRGGARPALLPLATTCSCISSDKRGSVCDIGTGRGRGGLGELIYARERRHPPNADDPCMVALWPLAPNEDSLPARRILFSTCRRATERQKIGV